jgi:hypothetical protein
VAGIRRREPPLSAPVTAAGQDSGRRQKYPGHRIDCALRLLSKFAIVKAPAFLAVGAAPFAWTLVPAAGNPAYSRDRADHRLVPQGDSKWLKVP